jgi:hypothetical protein
VLTLEPGPFPRLISPHKAGNGAGLQTKRKETTMSLKKTKTTNDAQTPKQPPAAKVRVGLVTASIWERNSENGTFYTVSFERRYRDTEGAWQTSHSYDAQDLLALAKAADLAHTRIIEAQQSSAD